MPVVVGTPACVPEGTISDVVVRIKGRETVPPIIASNSSRTSRRRPRTDSPHVTWMKEKLEITDGSGNKYAYVKELGGGNFAKAYLFASPNEENRLAVRVEWEGNEIVLPEALGAVEGLLLARTKSFFNARLQVMEFGVMTAEDFFINGRNAEYLKEFGCFVRALTTGLLTNGLTYYDLKPDNIVVCKCPSEGFLYFRAIDIDSVGSFEKPNNWAMFHVDNRPSYVTPPPAHSVVSTAFAALLTIHLAKRMSSGNYDLPTFFSRTQFSDRDEVPYTSDYASAAAHWRSIKDFAPFFRAVRSIRPLETSAAKAWATVKPTLRGRCARFEDRVML